MAHWKNRLGKRCQSDYSMDGILGIHLLQRDIADFGVLVEVLSLYDA